MDATDTEGIGLGCYGHMLTAEKTHDCLPFHCIWSTPVLHSLEEKCYFAHLRMLEVFYHMSAKSHFANCYHLITLEKNYTEIISL